VLAAIIAALISALAAVLTFVASRWQMRGKLLELELKKTELENTASAKMLELDLKRGELEKTGAKLQAEAEALRQTLMRDVLAKRMAAYAELWRVFITYERNWLLEQKSFDQQWASAFLLELNLCNANHGVFFSEEVYKPFFEYRERLLRLVAKTKSGNAISQDDIAGLMEVSTLGTPGKKSLGGAMKDDLGSYTRLVIQAS
jgi:hypothetical protein